MNPIRKTPIHVNRSTFVRSRLLHLGLLLAALPAACHQDPAPPVEAGSVLLSVGSIPENVACIQVAITGEVREVTRELDVVPGQSLTETFSALPVGPVVFVANAYAAACSSVTKSTVPTWVSEPKTVSVVQGKSSSVTLTLYKNGRAKVTVEFGDQDDGGHSDGSSQAAAPADGGAL